MAVKVDECPRCGEVTKLRHREFSDQALAALIQWGEIEREIVGKAVCEDCYEDLRESLIERGSELQTSKKGKKKKSSSKREAV